MLDSEGPRSAFKKLWSVLLTCLSFHARTSESHGGQPSLFAMAIAIDEADLRGRVVMPFAILLIISLDNHVIHAKLILDLEGGQRAAGRPSPELGTLRKSTCGCRSMSQTRSHGGNLR